MIDLIYIGGPVITIPQTVLALILIGLSVKIIFDLRRQTGIETTTIQRRIGIVLQLGLLCLFLGVLGQTLGLLEALSVINQVGDISPSLVIQGFLVSLITPLYGGCICLLAVITWLALKRWAASLA